MASADPDRAVREQRQILAVVTGCFLASGATGLIYQVLWTRMLSLVFGHTVFAITTVLSAFMAGLGLGSLLGGRVADRRRDPLAIYGWLEVGIGAYCLATPLLFRWAEVAYLALYRAFGLSLATFTSAQFLLAFAILLVPTTLMGATLPVLGRLMVREIGQIGMRVGLLYALNTFGAALGAFGSGFLMLPSLGTGTTLQLAAVVNLGIGLVALTFQRHLDRLVVRPSDASPASPGEPHADPGVEAAGGAASAAIPLTQAARCVVWAFGLSGAAAMISEVAWTRALNLIIGSLTYAFSTVLVAFLAGIVGGGAAFVRLVGRRIPELFHFAWLQVATGAGARLMVPPFEAMPDLFVRVGIARGDPTRALTAFERAARPGPLPAAVLRQMEDLEGDAPAP